MTTSSKKLTKKELKQGFWRSFTTSHAWNYERQQHLSFAYSILPIINKLYEDPQDRIAAYKRHLEFYNCQTTMHPFILGVTAAMEEENANNENFDTSSISSMKVALMGPLAGIGDSLIAGTLRILATGIVAGLCTQGNLFGPILFLILYNTPTILLRYFGITKGYQLGSTLISKIADSNVMSKVTTAMSVVGLMVIGAMVSSLVHVSTPLAIGLGKNSVSIQDTLNSIFPNMLPLIATGIIYKLTTKRVNVLVQLLAIMVISIAFGAFGILK